MTKRELELAQFFHNAHTRAYDLLDEIDPTRVQLDDPDKHKLHKELAAIAQIAAAAHNGFWQVVGRLPSQVSLTELSTVSPAEWTKRAREER